MDGPTPAKPEATQVDAIEKESGSEAFNDTHDHVAFNDGNEEIIHELQTAGEEIGMTLRTILAAVVSTIQTLHSYCLIFL